MSNSCIHMIRREYKFQVDPTTFINFPLYLGEFYLILCGGAVERAMWGGMENKRARLSLSHMSMSHCGLVGKKEETRSVVRDTPPFIIDHLFNFTPVTSKYF